ncbi:IclR family transcriptional regulator domain-containing protein [Saccharopolyspora sp. NPDC000995]
MSITWNIGSRLIRRRSAEFCWPRYQDGFALIDGEHEEGVRSVVALIRDRSGVIAAINISVKAARMSAQELRESMRTPRARTRRCHLR